MTLFILMWDGRRQIMQYTYSHVWTVVPERYGRPTSKKMSLSNRLFIYLNANAASASRHSEAN